MQNAGSLVGHFGGAQHLFGGGRCEHFPRSGGIQHTVTHVASVQGLVSGTPSGNQTDLAGLGVLAINDLQFVVHVYSGVGGLYPAQGIAGNVLDGID